MYDPKHIPSARYAGYKTEYRHPVLNAFRSYYNYDEHFTREQKQIARASYFGLCSFVDDHHGLWTKMTMHEESVGIPMILSGAGVPQGVCNTQVSLVDVHQTVLESSGLGETEMDKSLPGQSLFQTAKAPDDPNRVVFSEYHDGGSITGFMMLREGRWKYITYPGFAPQLFDLESDPFETNDLGLTTEHSPIRERLHQRMCKEFADPVVINENAFADQAERIKELGGIDGIYQRDNYDHTPVTD